MSVAAVLTADSGSQKEEMQTVMEALLAEFAYGQIVLTCPEWLW